jgi:hypothetical protein
LTGTSDAEQKDQQPSSDSNQLVSLLNKSSSAPAAASSGSTLLSLEADSDALTLTCSSKVGVVAVAAC